MFSLPQSETGITFLFMNITDSKHKFFVTEIRNFHVGFKAIVQPVKMFSRSNYLHEIVGHLIIKNFSSNSQWEIKTRADITQLILPG